MTPDVVPLRRDEIDDPFYAITARQYRQEHDDSERYAFTAQRDDPLYAITARQFEPQDLDCAITARQHKHEHENEHQHDDPDLCETHPGFIRGRSHIVLYLFIYLSVLYCI